MTDFLDVKLKEIRDRLKEIRPLVDEFTRLESAERALSGLEEESTPAQPRARAARPSGSANGGSTGRRRGRPKGGGTRSKQALELVRSRPGITIPELADAMRIKQNYLYRVMPSLADEGLVHKSGRGWHVRDGQPATATGDSGRDAADTQNGEDRDAENARDGASADE